MKISLNWLRELVDLSPDASAEDIAKVLTRQGLEVEGIEYRGRDLSGVLIAEVKSTRPHPKADKLRLVSIVAGESHVELVCGAGNIPAPGGKVAWAAPGALLPGGVKIEAREVRGVLSPGMLCGEPELGLSTDDTGLLVLDSDSIHGRDLASSIGAKDEILEVNVTPNRADALSHWGVARELAAWYGTTVRLPSIAGIQEVDSEVAPHVDVSDSVGCPRYYARTLIGLQNGPSPVWMRLRLVFCGMRSISRLVDITNYVLLELGHPQHAFDYLKLAGGVDVRSAKQDESIVTLDGQARSLEPSDLVIADRSGPIAVAGVMGGAATEVSGETTAILLETATFAPSRVRKTAKRLGLSSEASYRFERGVNPESVPFASLRACSLFAQLAGGKLVKEVLDHFPSPLPPRTVALTKSRLTRVSGREFDLETVHARLTRYGFKCTSTGESLEVTVPSHRLDISIPEDLVEEVLRSGEYDRSVDVSRIESNSLSIQHPEATADKLRLLLAGQGLSEIVTWAFIPNSQLQIISGGGENKTLAAGIHVKNPISSDYEVMRTSLFPGLATVAKRNVARGVDSICIFEVGPVVHRSEIPSNPPVQLMHAAGLMIGHHAGWLRPGEAVDFYDAKRIMVEALGSLGIPMLKFTAPAETPFLHPGISAKVSSDDGIGIIGQVHPIIAKKLDLVSPAYYFEIWVDALENRAKSIRTVSPPRFPPSTRDISFWVDTSVDADNQRSVISGSGEPLLESLEVLEDYRDSRYVPSGQKGMLWKLTYRSPERTLTDIEVDQAHARVLKHLSANLPIQIR